VRHVRLTSGSDLDRPEIAALIAAALAQAGLDPPPERAGRVIVKAVSAKQRPRRPGAGPAIAPDPRC
jgi:hypothetical protein